MAWEAYALGSLNQVETLDASIAIINRELGSCTRSGSDVTYTFNGVTYSFSSTTSSSKWMQGVLCLNKETGEFVISCANSGSIGSSMSDRCFGAVLRIQMDKDNQQLIPVKQLGTFTDVFAVCSSSYNTSTTLPLRQAFTGTYYNENVADCRYRPIVDMYETFGYSIAPGTYLRVDGQNFLCVMHQLFVKL